MKRGAEDGIALVKPNSRLSSFERLEIYNRSYWSRVLDAFSEDFPGVRALLGAKQFDRLRRRYLVECPSESFTMRNLGRNLAAWMERNPELAGPHYGIALEMARLEWAEIDAFDGPELPPFTSGAVGYAGYDVIRYSEQLPNARSMALDQADSQATTRRELKKRR